MACKDCRFSPSKISACIGQTQSNLMESFYTVETDQPTRMTAIGPSITYRLVQQSNGVLKNLPKSFVNHKPLLPILVALMHALSLISSHTMTGTLLP